MTAPIPEEQDQPPVTVDDPPGEHGSELPDDREAGTDARAREGQDENAETSLDQPSDDTEG